jgi:hypothetical protein
MQQNEWNTKDPKIYKASRYLLNAGYYIMIAELELQAECWRLSCQDLFWSYDRILYMLYVGPIIFMVILLGWSFIFSGPPVPAKIEASSDIIIYQYKSLCQRSMIEPHQDEGTNRLSGVLNSREGALNEKLSCGVSPTSDMGNRGSRMQGSRQTVTMTPIQAQIKELIGDWSPS